MSPLPTASPVVSRPGLTGPRWHSGFLLEPALTGSQGAPDVVRLAVPAGSAVPLHAHEHEDETLVLQEGELALDLDGHQWRAGPGSIVFIPRGTPHAMRAESETVHLLAIGVPAGEHETLLSAAA